MKTTLAVSAAALTLTATALLAPGVGQAEMAAGTSSCSQLRQDYANGVAKTKKAANRIIKKGYERPIVCKRLYVQVKQSLDPNRNGVACETR